MAAVPTTEPEILKYLATFKGTITAQWVKENPSLKPLEGMTAVQAYHALKTANPSASPLTIGQTITEIWIGGGLAGALKGLTLNLGAATAATQTGIQTAQYVPSWSSGLTGLLSALANPHTWIRVAEGLLGIVLIAVGLARMTHAVPVATAIARRVP